MTDIQRWDPIDGMVKGENAYYVTYADHVEALRQARDGFESEMQELSNHMENSAQERYRRGYEQGQRDTLAAAEATPHSLWCDHVESEGGEPCDCGKAAVIATIKGEPDD